VSLVETTAATPVHDASPRSAKAAATRAKLLDAGEQVFGAVGFDATRVADIVSAAGVSHGLFYKHFADKAAILSAILARQNTSLRHMTGRMVGEDRVPTLAQLETRNILFFKEYAEHRRLLRVSREAAARNDDSNFRSQWLNIRGHFTRRTIRWLQELTDGGHVPQIDDPVMLAEALSALVEQMAYVHVGLSDNDPDDADLERMGKVCGLIWYRSIFGAATGSNK
jgi:AcrR family transcriptional regulator